MYFYAVTRGISLRISLNFFGLMIKISLTLHVYKSFCPGKAQIKETKITEIFHPRCGQKKDVHLDKCILLIIFKGQLLSHKVKNTKLQNINWLSKFSWPLSRLCLLYVYVKSSSESTVISKTHKIITFSNSLLRPLSSFSFSFSISIKFLTLTRFALHEGDLVCLFLPLLPNLFQIFNF